MQKTYINQPHHHIYIYINFREREREKRSRINHEEGWFINIIIIRQE
jgi:hypothetical protein